MTSRQEVYIRSSNTDTKYLIVFDQSLSMISQQNLDLIRAQQRERPDTRKARTSS